MAVVQKRVTSGGQVRWRVLIRLRGHPTVCKTFNAKAEANRWAREKEDKIRAGKSHSSESSKTTFSEALDKYLHPNTDGGLVSKHRATEKGIRRKLEWWRSHLGAYHLAAINWRLVREVKTTYLKGRLEGATVNRYLMVLSAFFRRWAVKEYGLPGNPLSHVDKEPESPPRDRVLTNDEKARVFAACQERDDRLAVLAVLGVYTGIRQGELLSLRWSDVEPLSEGMVKVRAEISKNSQAREVALNGPALDTLKTWGKVRPINSNAFIFEPRKRKRTSERTNGNPPSFPRKAWNAALAEAGIEGACFHTLRHSFCTYLQQSGANALDIAEQAGHKSLATTKRYVHSDRQHKREVIERMTEKYGNVEGENSTHA